MNKYKNFIYIFFLFIIFFIGIVSAVSVSTDKVNYNFGETVFIYGSGFLSDEPVAVQIDNPNAVHIFANTTYANETGDFTNKFLIPSQNPPVIIEGTYTVYVSDGGSTTFQVLASASTTTTTTSTTTTTTINPINYIEVNGTTFIQPSAINITGWSNNLSSNTYLWNNYTGTLQSMPPTGLGVQINITQSSNLNLGIYRVSSNSTWNSTLSSKTFTVTNTTTTTTIEGATTTIQNNNQGTTTTVSNVTTTTTTLATTTSVETITTTPSTTTTTITEEKYIKIKPWYVLLMIAIFVTIGVAIWYFKYMKESREAKFEQLKEKWDH